MRKVWEMYLLKEKSDETVKGKLLIIGAGKFQVPGIKKAQDLGYYVIATDGNEKAVGKYYADEFYHLDVKNLKKNLNLAKQKSITGVCAIASEVSLKTVSYISEKLQIPGNDLNVTRLAHNKLKYYNLFSKKDIKIPFTLKYNIDNLRKFKGEKVVIKPSQGSGSRLVKILNSKKADDYVQGNKDKVHEEETFLIQKYISGQEITVDGFVNNDSKNVLAVSEEKCNSSYSNSVSSELVFPPQISKNLFERIKQISRKAVEAMNIQFGPFHMEFLINEGEIFLIDFALRGGGFRLFTDIVEKTSGVDVLKKYIQGVMGEDIVIREPVDYKPVILKFLYTNKSGRIKEIKNNNPEGYSYNYIIDFLKKTGDYVKKPVSGKDRLAYIIAWEDKLDRVKKRIKKLENNIEFIIN